MERFEVIREPAGTWAVFDNLHGIFAQLEGEVLVGLQIDAAEDVLDRVKLDSPFYTRLPRPIGRFE